MKTIQKILMTFVVSAFIAIPAFSQEAVKGTSPSNDKTTPAKVAQGKFTDQNKNGVCDNFEARGKSGKGENFTDKNNDGVCDNRGNSGKGKGYGSGQGKGCGQGCQHGRGQGNCNGAGPGSGKGKVK